VSEQLILAAHALLTGHARALAMHSAVSAISPLPSPDRLVRRQPPSHPISPLGMASCNPPRVFPRCADAALRLDADVHAFIAGGRSQPTANRNGRPGLSVPDRLGHTTSLLRLQESAHHG
jgi:hypothetical protein